ncbi:hypothetical protein [Enterobacter phage 01_vB_Eclo_IJM]|nr:hypothetical protein [Enterobacter phage 01_vB_Eclo_IJM]
MASRWTSCRMGLTQRRTRQRSTHRPSVQP